MNATNYRTEEFESFPKIARLARQCIITEKIDGTNAQIFITDDGRMKVGSRNRWVTLENDNFGFAKWAMEHRDELMTLGVGRHYGEWWGHGIQRGYGLLEKRFSLFNVSMWCLHGTEPKQIPTGDPRIVKMQKVLPPCCGLVPVLDTGIFCIERCKWFIDWLRVYGSAASPGFMNPEGIVAHHVAGGVSFKMTIENDDVPKSIA